MRRLFLFVVVLAFGALQGCATMLLHEMSKDVEATRDQRIELVGDFHDNRVAMATLAWQTDAPDTIRIWKLAGSNLWLKETSEWHRIYIDDYPDTAQDATYHIPHIWKRGRGEKLEVMLLADDSLAVPGQYLSQLSPRRIWLVGSREADGLWYASRRLYPTADGISMTGITNGSREVLNYPILVKGLYAVTVPLDIVLSPGYLVAGLLGLAFIGLSGTHLNGLYSRF